MRRRPERRKVRVRFPLCESRQLDWSKHRKRGVRNPLFSTETVA
nr:MAG TPA: hypothetical protein [Caudoviricetes sp.]